MGKKSADLRVKSATWDVAGYGFADRDMRAVERRYVRYVPDLSS